MSNRRLYTTTWDSNIRTLEFTPSYRTLLIVLAAVALNTILDPLLIAGFGWGMAGAAYATVAAQGGAFLYGLIYCIRTGRVPFTRPAVPEK